MGASESTSYRCRVNSAHRQGEGRDGDRGFVPERTETLTYLPTHPHTYLRTYLHTHLPTHPYLARLRGGRPPLEALSNELGTHKTVKAISCSWLSGESRYTISSGSLFDRKRWEAHRGAVGALFLTPRKRQRGREGERWRERASVRVTERARA